MRPPVPEWVRNHLKSLDAIIRKALVEHLDGRYLDDDLVDGIDLVNDPLFSPEADAERGFPPRPSAN